MQSQAINELDQTSSPVDRISQMKSASFSGVGMDRPVKQGSLKIKVFMVIAFGLAVLVTANILLGEIYSGRSLQIAGNRLTVSKVINGTFEDFIPLRSKVAPLRTVFLDVMQGGRVEEILIEDGAIVEKGQTILRLSNSDLQLSVMSTESRVMEQLNAMKDQELRLEQNRLNHKRTLMDLDYNILQTRREIARKKDLIVKGHLSQSEFDDLKDELNYLQEKREVTIESQASDEKLMATQLKFFKEKTKSMEENLAFARKSLQDLVVHAPVTGRISGFDLEIGQNVPRGMRIGQISNPSTFKLTANIDEYYLGRVDLDQPASFQRDGGNYSMRVSKIYPDIRNGQFQVDLKFVGELPKDLRRGQTIQSKLVLGDSNDALLIPNGQFFQDTGGKWIFLVEQGKTTASKRNIRLGRRNNDYVEILAGLEEGDEVITSSYSSFKEMDRLKLTKD